jgi:hypothetical protein
MTDDSKWQREQPATEGDWLWVEMWGCGCCVRNCGIAFVDGDGMLSFEGHPPSCEQSITGWLPVELPDSDWVDILNVPLKNVASRDKSGRLSDDG